MLRIAPGEQVHGSPASACTGVDHPASTVRPHPPERRPVVVVIVGEQRQPDGPGRWPAAAKPYSSWVWRRPRCRRCRRRQQRPAGQMPDGPPRRPSRVERREPRQSVRRACGGSTLRHASAGLVRLQHRPRHRVDVGVGIAQQPVADQLRRTFGQRRRHHEPGGFRQQPAQGVGRGEVDVGDPGTVQAQPVGGPAKSRRSRRSWASR